MTDMGVLDTQADIAKGQEGPAAQAKQPDVTILHPPMNPARHGIQQIVDCFRFGTPFVKQLILQEADVIYECRVCRSLFRGLLNFIEHKKCFCVERVSSDSQLAGRRQNTDAREHGISNDEAASILSWGGPGPEKEIRKNAETASVTEGKASNQSSTELKDIYDGEENDRFVVLRPIPTTSRAIEQQIVRSDQILHEEEINKLSAFRALRDQGDQSEDTSKIVGEITIRQAAKAGRVAVPTFVDKRETLHTLLKTVNSQFYAEKSTSPSSDATSKRETLTVDVSTPKSAVSPAASRTSVSPRVPVPDKKASSVSPRQKKVATTPRPTTQQMSARNICKVCKKKCKNWTALAWHMRIHKKPLFKCPLCQYRSPSVYNVRRHIQAMHNLSTDRVDELLSRKIEEKGTEVSTESKSGQNNNDSSSPPACDICFKTFANRRNVARHKVIHEREKLQAEGKYTPASNATQEEIARGKVMQTMDEKNMRCRRCHKQLSTVRRLQQHCCNHFGYNRYRCRMCPYENNDYTQMRRHMMGKHGRQFRTIQQISEAIKSMKVGVWINLTQSQNTDDNDSKKAGISANKSSKAEEKNPKQGASVSKAGSSTTKQGSTATKQIGSATKSMSTTADKVGTKGVEDGKSSVSSSPVRVKAESESKKVTDSPSKDVPSSSANSPGTSRRSLVDTVAAGKERETPMRQARLNHRSVSPKGPQEKEEEEDKALLQMMMDKKNMKCLKCKKRFQYHSSLLRHTRIHLLEESSSSEQGGTKKNRESASKKAQAIKSLINPSQLRCLRCRKRFTSMSTLKQHVGRHLGYNTFKCRYCGYLSHNYSWFKNHLMIKHASHVANITDLGQLIGSMKTK
ncbi:zinc finger protein 800-like [Acanthaster planci]|uniref:Zinc finger protein 800-like n=1 Tax=Acanthaster planci TaxID=133434 RepID=A0A8B7ZE75_ACAPL|nr:zinc finger protein 800-like [Acanthaster planci]